MEGMVQLKIQSVSNDTISDNDTSTIPPILVRVKDSSIHIDSIRENKKVAQIITNFQNEQEESIEEVDDEEKVDDTDNKKDDRYSISLPRFDHYFPVIRYKCNNILPHVLIVSVIIYLGYR